MRLGIGDTLVKQPSVQLVVGLEPQPRREEALYDNMKTAVEAIFVGKDRLYNRRFLQLCSHYLIEPVACTPAAGWEKGPVENQVGLIREVHSVMKDRNLKRP